jgi:hypothetical protein
MAMRWLTLAAALALTIAVPVQAQVGGQELSVSVSPPPSPLVPEQEFVVVVSVTASCDGLLKHVAPTAGGAVATVTWRAPASILISGSTSVTFSPEGCAGRTEMTVDAPFNITMTREAPGLKSIATEVGASWASPPFGESAWEKVTFAADYYPLTLVKVAQKVKVCGCDRFDFEVELTNHGNARTQHNFEILKQPDGGKWDILLPDPVILDSPYGGGEGKTVDTAIVSITGGEAGKGGYTLRILVVSADQPDKTGEPIEVHLLARKVGVVDRLMPAPGAPVLLLGLVALAMALRRRA